VSKTQQAIVLAAIATLLIAPATASDFCGCNGMMKLSLREFPEFAPIATVEPNAQGFLTVDIWAVLDDVQPMEGPGGVLLAIGGFEFDLRITGAEPMSVAKSILVPHRDFGQKPTQVWAGTDLAGERIDMGPLPLCKWTVVFQGAVTDVHFDFEPAGLLSCDGMEGCGGANVQAMYSGCVDARQENFIFGVGSTPAVLNPTDSELQIQPVPCVKSFEDVGIFERRLN